MKWFRTSKSTTRIVFGRVIRNLKSEVGIERGIALRNQIIFYYFRFPFCMGI